MGVSEVCRVKEVNINILKNYLRTITVFFLGGGGRKRYN